MDQSEFNNTIREWVSIDNTIKTNNESIKNLRKQKTDLLISINKYVEENELESATVKINDGFLKFRNVKQTAPLTLKYIEQCLEQCLDDVEKIGEIMDVIKTNRESKYNFDIKRTYK